MLEPLSRLKDSNAQFSSFPALKKLTKGRSDDWVDRLSHIHSAILLVVFAAFITTAQFTGDRIRCWTPAEFKIEYENYVHQYCWVKNTYYVPPDDFIPLDMSKHKDAEITYYQWVPMILLFQAFLFKFPNLLWEIAHHHAGIKIGQIVKLAGVAHYKSIHDRKLLIENMSATMTKWLEAEKQYKHSKLVRLRASFSRVFFFDCNKRAGSFLTGLYISVKVLYLLNAIGQFLMLNAFMASDFNDLGSDWIQMLKTGKVMKESSRFPRVTLCDFKIRQLENIQDWTVQCVIPINLFNEKIFIFIWFWLILMMVVSSYSVLRWVYLIVLKKNNHQYVWKHIKLANYQTPKDKILCKEFAEDFLREDGCFVARIIGMNTNEIVSADLLESLFQSYKSTHNGNGNGHESGNERAHDSTHNSNNNEESDKET